MLSMCLSMLVRFLVRTHAHPMLCCNAEQSVVKTVKIASWFILLKLRCYEVFLAFAVCLQFCCFHACAVECAVYAYLFAGNWVEWLWINSICHGEEITRQENNHQIANANDLSLHHFQSELAKEKKTKWMSRNWHSLSVCAVHFFLSLSLPLGFPFYLTAYRSANGLKCRKERKQNDCSQQIFAHIN